MKSSKAYVFLALVLLLSCSNDDFQIDEVDGVIVDTSNMAGLEACGFMVRIDGALYKPTYLNSEYEQDGFAVLMKVEFLNSASDCSTLQQAPLEIRIEQIRPAD